MLATLGSHVYFYSLTLIRWLNASEWFFLCVQYLGCRRCDCINLTLIYVHEATCFSISSFLYLLLYIPPFNTIIFYSCCTFQMSLHTCKSNYRPCLFEEIKIVFQNRCAYYIWDFFFMIPRFKRRLLMHKIVDN